jgi:type I restriction enzyme R subunit
MFTEASTVQAPLISRLVDKGYEHIYANQVPRANTDVLVEPWVRQAIRRLNPQIQTQQHEDLAYNHILSCISSTESLLDANRRFHRLLVGKEGNFVLPDHNLPMDQRYFPLRLIDYDTPDNNQFVVVGGDKSGQEITFIGKDRRRFDVALYVNGIPLVIIETKSCTDPKTSWRDAARDIHDVYQQKCSQMFVPNLLSVATDGRHLRIGSITADEDNWLPWEDHNSQHSSSLERCFYQAQQVLNPQTLLLILQHYVMYYAGARGSFKIIPRPIQVDAAEKILDRVKDANRHQGLVFHSQGSGKTYGMVYAASRIHRDPETSDRLILVVVDRVDLFAQTKREFQAVDESAVFEADSMKDLAHKIQHYQSGILITTVHKFQDQVEPLSSAPAVVLVDEAHRTQEGSLASGMRNALPNATIIGFTGTPIVGQGHNTRSAFGDASDPGRVMSAYRMSDSIADGVTLPWRVFARMVNDKIDDEALDNDFEDYAGEEGLPIQGKGALANRAANLKVMLNHRSRLEAVARDIAYDFSKRVDPRHMKAQVVVWDRATCVKMYDALRRALDDRGRQDIVTRVIMSGYGDKDTPPEWEPHCPTPTQEEELQRRFLNQDDPFKIAIVCNKWLTGFDAPNEGTIYIDRPMTRHTLFQAVSRTNRPYHGKTHGIVVDYVGAVKNRLVEALQSLDKDVHAEIVDQSESKEAFIQALEKVKGHLSFIDRNRSDDEQIIQAQEHFDTPDKLALISSAVHEMHDIWEDMWPTDSLRPYRDDYTWVAKIHEGVRSAFGTDRKDIWGIHGAHILQIIDDHVDSGVRGSWPDGVLFDQQMLDDLRNSGSGQAAEIADDVQGQSAQEAIDSLQNKLREAMATTSSPNIYVSLSERLEQLRRMIVESTKDGDEALRKILGIRKEFEQAESLGEEADSLLDRRIGPMTEILQRHGPKDVQQETLDAIAYKIDAALRDELVYRHWGESEDGRKAVRRNIRLILIDHDAYRATEATRDELVDKLFDYARDNYAETDS